MKGARPWETKEGESKTWRRQKGIYRDGDEGKEQLFSILKLFP